jgi:hypothetical protein
LAAPPGLIDQLLGVIGSAEAAVAPTMMVAAAAAPASRTCRYLRMLNQSLHNSFADGSWA